MVLSATVCGSAADSGKTRNANQNETQAKRATHTRAEGGWLQPLIGQRGHALYVVVIATNPSVYQLKETQRWLH